MTRVALKRVRKPKAPALRFSRDFWETASKVVVGDMLDRIDKQRQPDGARIKRNAPSTRARKRAQGKPQLSLVDEAHRFFKPSGYTTEHLSGGRGIVVAPRDREVARSLIARGYRWIGLSNKGWAAVRALVRAEIRKAIKAVRVR